MNVLLEDGIGNLVQLLLYEHGGKIVFAEALN